MKKRKIVFLEELPFSPCNSPKKRIRTNCFPKTNNYQGTLEKDTSGTLLVNKWKSAWYYRDHHVRVTMSHNPTIQEDMIFSNSKTASNALMQPCYFNIHKAIVHGMEINGCYLEYTITKVKGVNHYLHGDKTIKMSAI
jgi:hypothetical protein